ncbi:hypothetical protein LTR94_035579, partial [Friedmanniomyces endolithicus]
SGGSRAARLWSSRPALLCAALGSDRLRHLRLQPGHGRPRLHPRTANAEQAGERGDRRDREAREGHQTRPEAHRPTWQHRVGRRRRQGC